jgi:hypothetical protein
MACALVILISAGCRPNAKAKHTALLQEFQRQMDDINASLPEGTTYSNLIAKIGQPTFSETNNGYIMVAYVSEPKFSHLESMTNGFEFVFSNNVVVRKFPIISGGQM